MLVWGARLGFQEIRVQEENLLAEGRWLAKRANGGVLPESLLAWRARVFVLTPHPKGLRVGSIVLGWAATPILAGPP